MKQNPGLTTCSAVAPFLRINPPSKSGLSAKDKPRNHEHMYLVPLLTEGKATNVNFKTTCSAVAPFLRFNPPSKSGLSAKDKIRNHEHMQRI